LLRQTKASRFFITNSSRVIAIFPAELLDEILVDCGSPGVTGAPVTKTLPRII
jgi:hypothetical protein